jgi:hypothetical protein
MRDANRKHLQLRIDPESVRQSRRELAQIVRGNPIAEAALEGFSDWEVVEALERMWAVGLEPDRAEDEPDPAEDERTRR